MEESSLQSRPRLIYQHSRHHDVRIEVEEAEPRPTTSAEAMLRQGASSISSVCTLCNTAIGSGVLALPFAFGCTGLAGCLLLYLAVAVLEGFTMYVLAKLAERYDAESYGSLVRKALGRKTSAIQAAVMIIYLWGSSLSYLVIAADTFTSVSLLYFGPEAPTSQRHVILFGTGLLVLCLCFPRQLQTLDRVSAAAVLAFVFTVIAVTTRGIQEAASRHNPWDGVELFKFNESSLYAISIVVFGFNCHANVIGVFHELDHYPHRLIRGLPATPVGFHELGPLAPKPYTHKLIGMLGAIIAYMSIMFLGYAAVGMSGYFAFPTSISSNVLNSFPAGDGAIQGARIAIGFVVIASFPLNHHPARGAFKDLLDAAANVKVTPNWAEDMFTVAFVVSTLGTALVVTDLGEVLHLVGGTAASLLVFFLPGVLLMNAAIVKQSVAQDLSGLTSRLLPPLEQQGVEQDGRASAAAVLEQAGNSGSILRPIPSWSSLHPLVGKKAGLRESGLVFAPGKSWFLGLFLMVVSLLVLVVTLATL